MAPGADDNIKISRYQRSSSICIFNDMPIAVGLDVCRQLPSAAAAAVSDMDLVGRKRPELGAAMLPIQSVTASPTSSTL